MGSQQAKPKSVTKSKTNFFKTKNRKLSQNTGAQSLFLQDLGSTISLGKQSLPASRKVSDNMTEESENCNHQRKISFISSTSSITFSNSSSDSSQKQSSNQKAEMEQQEKDFQMMIQEQGSTTNPKFSGLFKRKQNFSEIMMQRWKGYMQEIPSQDRVDLVHSFMNERVQNCPEYSQEVYLNMRIQEEQQFTEWMESYTSAQRSGQGRIIKAIRDENAERIIYLCKEKNYKIETMHLALNIFDRVLVSNKVSLTNKETMPLIIITAVILAAKIEQPLTPSIKMTIKLFPENERALLTKEKVIHMENIFLRILDFDLQLLSPLTFLERFLRLSNADCNDQISLLAKEILFVAKCKNQFLEYKSSHIAAAALIIATNTCQEIPRSSLRPWDQNLEDYSLIKKEELIPIFEAMMGICNIQQKHQEDQQQQQLRLGTKIRNDNYCNYMQQYL